jgi:hypothetical protein
MNPTTTQVPFSPAGEAHFQALREAHDKQESKKVEDEKNEPKNEDTAKLEVSIFLLTITSLTTHLAKYQTSGRSCR